MATNDLDNFFKQSITVNYNGEQFEFRIPSMKDKITIDGVAAKLRRDGDPDGIGLVYGYDPMALGFTIALAKFSTLIKGGPPWVYTPDKDGKPIIDINKWPDNTPIEEVVAELDKQLDEFRENWNKPKPSTN